MPSVSSRLLLLYSIV